MRKLYTVALIVMGLVLLGVMWRQHQSDREQREDRLSAIKVEIKLKHRIRTLERERDADYQIMTMVLLELNKLLQQPQEIILDGEQFLAMYKQGEKHLGGQLNAEAEGSCQFKYCTDNRVQIDLVKMATWLISAQNASRRLSPLPDEVSKIKGNLIDLEGRHETLVKKHVALQRYVAKRRFP